MTAAVRIPHAPFFRRAHDGVRGAVADLLVKSCVRTHESLSILRPVTIFLLFFFP